MTDHFVDVPKKVLSPTAQAVQRLCDAAFLRGADGVSRGEIEVSLILEAFAAGADQELEACCEWLDFYSATSTARGLRAARRPKPPSLKDQALLAIDVAVADGRLSPDVSKVVRRALEALPND